MAAAKYLGYVGGVAVAVGVGAAIAAAGEGTAHADTDTGSTAKAADSTSADAVNAGPKKADTRTHPLKDLHDRVDKVASTLTKPAAAKPAATVKKPRPTAAEFEARQVERLKELFQPNKSVATPQAETKPHTRADKNDAANNDADKNDAPGPAVRVQADSPTPSASSTGVLPPGEFPSESDPNPLRAEDPTPFAMPGVVRDVENALLASPLVPDALAPIVREGYELAYRGTQMVPWVNVVVPISEVLPQLQKALAGDPDAKDATQIIINQLLVTTQPVSIVYYGYDQVADILNVEEDAQLAKENFYATAWDTLDPLAILHNAGESGLERYPDTID